MVNSCSGRSSTGLGTGVHKLDERAVHDAIVDRTREPPGYGRELLENKGISGYFCYTPTAYISPCTMSLSSPCTA